MFEIMTSLWGQHMFEVISVLPYIGCIFFSASFQFLTSSVPSAQMVSFTVLNKTSNGLNLLLPNPPESYIDKRQHTLLLLIQNLLTEGRLDGRLEGHQRSLIIRHTSHHISLSHHFGLKQRN